MTVLGCGRNLIQVTASFMDSLKGLWTEKTKFPWYFDIYWIRIFEFWSDVWPSMLTQWPILGICALHLTHPSAHTHTVNTHREQWAANARRPGSSWGFDALLKGLTSVVVLKVERTLVIHSPHWQFLPDPRLEPTTSGYKSDALSIRLRLP